jgi:hypothetical protein
MVCRYCGHMKHEHTGHYMGQPATACVAIEGSFVTEPFETVLCDCPEWVYGVNADKLPKLPDDESEADEYFGERADHLEETP